MATTVREIMNRELLSVGEGEPIARALDDILAFEITAAPVLDDLRRPIGIVSLRDLQAPRGRETVGEVMTHPAATISESDTIQHCSSAMAEEYLHHLVVVDADGRATGMVSALDVMCAPLGKPVQHPSPFRTTTTSGRLFYRRSRYPTAREF
jgi:CBS-domain-containing membrane protein